MRPAFLFITRNYPPKVGGLENYSYNLIREFEPRTQTFKLALSKSNAHLLWFLPYCLLAATWICRRRGVRRIHLTDALLAPLGLALKRLTGAQVSASVVGLDITYANRLYQLVVPRCAARLDRLVCISRATLAECTARGVPQGKCIVIPAGVRCGGISNTMSRDEARRRLAREIGLALENKRVLVTVGRLVRRKGVAWFTDHVVPRLGEEFVYLVVGRGPERARIEAAAARHGLGGRMALLGRLTDAQRDLLLRAADCFVMPNISVDGDIEGFGIVALEAGDAGLPVVASDLQGIRDAILDGRTGHLVPERDAAGFIAAIRSCELDRASIRRAVRETFDWPRVAERYFEFLAGTCRRQTNAAAREATPHGAWHLHR